MNNVQHLLLAAGASERMGKPKQLLPWVRNTLIEHQVEVLLESNKKVTVILGAYSELITDVIKKYPVDIFTNEDWRKGMGSSLSFGIKKLLEKNSTVDGILISLTDQPMIKPGHLKKMLDNFEPGKGEIIVSKSSEGWFGSPVIFDMIYFDNLLSLKGDEGAKKIIHKNRFAIKFIDGGSMLVDMDTPETYRMLLDESIKKLI